MPPPPRQIFFCSPLPHRACTFYSFLLSTCTAHLLSPAHPELTAVHAANGLTALEALVRRGTLTTDRTPAATVIFVCDFQNCRHYRLTLDEAVAHCSESHKAYTDVVRAEFGTVGVTKMVEERMKHAVVMDAPEPAAAPEDEADNDEEEESDESESDHDDDDVRDVPGTIMIAGVGYPMLAETVVQLADMIRRGAGPRIGGWASAMRSGEVRVHVDRRNGGGSTVCSVRDDERVALLKRVMAFGVVRLGDEEEE